MSNKQIKRKAHLELHVVLDSSVLFTPSATEFLSYGVTQIIKESNNYSDLSVLWYVPEVVVHERHYQMLSKATEFLQSTRKLEKFLGHRLNVETNALTSRVDELIKDALDKNHVETINLDPNKVNWHQMMLDAVNREPPFEVGDKEKGFRDALIAECYMQLLAALSDNQRFCRIVLATQDDILAKAVHQRIEHWPKANAPCRIEELKGLINTLNSEVNEQYIKRLQEAAKDFFFIPGVSKSFFVKQEVSSQIERKFHDKLLELPEGAERRVNSAWTVAPPQFDKKVGQRVFWVSQISLEHSAYKTSYRNMSPNSGSLRSGSSIGYAPSASGIVFPTGTSQGGVVPMMYSGINPISTPGAVSPYNWQPDSGTYIYNQPSMVPYDELVAIGQTVFEVAWSVEALSAKKLRRPKIEDIRLMQTSWF